ncbi:uncharacterized protein PAN0_017c5420 [Moesziomyces antarcticus]|uniref:Uncharacterized protein n=2 Tax=Pseudozyma antarctica TaxID=84753 RepID=A0A081CKJ8_PSEA2|nr:uncharacterized protein PAN0_017c5420 [Moesziomyces antarcticus]GAK67194.1 hypothetical protein PAN0_017c5420 [Moesziomyces antarcticus]SPO48199.1 uncharacterized protein PSANT_05887 [Moesziomyces antarcticus]
MQSILDTPLDYSDISNPAGTPDSAARLQMLTMSVLVARSVRNDQLLEHLCRATRAPAHRKAAVLVDRRPQVFFARRGPVRDSFADPLMSASAGSSSAAEPCSVTGP